MLLLYLNQSLEFHLKKAFQVIIFPVNMCLFPAGCVLSNLAGHVGGIAVYGSVWVDLYAPKESAASWLGAMQVTRIKDQQKAIQLAKSIRFIHGLSWFIHGLSMVYHLVSLKSMVYPWFIIIFIHFSHSHGHESRGGTPHWHSHMNQWKMFQSWWQFHPFLTPFLEFLWEWIEHNLTSANSQSWLGKSRNSVLAIQDFDGTDQLSVRSLKHGVSMEPSCSYHEISAEIFKASSLIGLVIGYTVAGKGDLAEASLYIYVPPLGFTVRTARLLGRLVSGFLHQPRMVPWLKPLVLGDVFSHLLQHEHSNLGWALKHWRFAGTLVGVVVMPRTFLGEVGRRNSNQRLSFLISTPGGSFMGPGEDTGDGDGTWWQLAQLKSGLEKERNWRVFVEFCFWMVWIKIYQDENNI